MNKNLIGKKWEELSEEQKEKLLTFSNCIDGVTGDSSKGGECIVDLTDTLSIEGFLTDEGDIIISDNNVIYSPIC